MGHKYLFSYYRPSSTYWELKIKHVTKQLIDMVRSIRKILRKHGVSHLKLRLECRWLDHKRKGISFSISNFWGLLPSIKIKPNPSLSLSIRGTKKSLGTLTVMEDKLQKITFSHNFPILKLDPGIKETFTSTRKC